MTPPADTARSFFAFTTSRPVAVTMMVIAALVFGLVSLARLPVNLLPDISYPTATIRTSYPGAAPQDVEERVSQRIHDSVAVISGVRRVVSISRPGVSDVVLSFGWGTNMVAALSDIRERLDRVFLPAEAEKPLVLRYDPSQDPVLTLGLRGDKTLVEMRKIADEEIVDAGSLRSDGVAAVKVRGGDEEEIRVVVDELALTAMGLDVALIGRRLAAENLNAASGVVEEGATEFLVRALGEFKSLAEIEQLILERRSGVSIRLADVAKVIRVPKEKEVISRIDGVPCVLLDVYKETGANVVALCRRVEARAFGTAAQQAFVASGRLATPLEDHVQIPATVTDPAQRQRDTRTQLLREQKLREEMTDFLAHRMQKLGLALVPLQDQSRFIESAIQDVQHSAVEGAVLAIVVIYLFLRRFTPTAIMSVSIPISLVAAFAPMHLSGISLNVMSLGGLALGVGRLVDDSIVVLESITKARDEGLDRVRAAIVGTQRVAGAVIASTLTTIAVFVPIVFVEGVAGQLFRDQALTVVYSIGMSLLMALFVVPMLASRGRSATPPPPPVSRLGRGLQRLAGAGFALFAGGVRLLGKLADLLLWPATKAFQAGYGLLDRSYPSVLTWALRHRAVVLGAALALLALSLTRVSHLGNELIPESHQGEIFLDCFLPRDATVEHTDQVLAPLERQIAQLPDVASTFLAVGVDKKELNDSDQGEHSARCLIRLKPDPERATQEQRVREQVRELVRARPEIRSYRFAQPSLFSFTAPLVVEVVGRDLVALRRAAGQVEAALQAVPGLADVRSTLQRGNTEISLRLDRDKLAAQNLDAGQITRILAAKLQGDVATRFAERERKIEIRVRRAQEELDSVSALLAVNVNPAGNPAVPLAAVAQIEQVEGPSEIRRLGNVRGAEIMASLTGFDLGSTQERVLEALAQLELPRGIDTRPGGQKEEMERSLESLVLALLLAIFLVYFVMASQFESIVQPFVILLAMPLALVGVVLVLEVLAIPVSVIVLLGAIVLAGVVVTNAIVLIDQINQYREQGMAKFEAIVAGAHGRLRPVMMTTLTTLLGLLPMTGWLTGIPLIGGPAEGLELRAPMAITLIAGLSSSTLLTLVVIPTAYSFADRRR